MTFFNFFLEKMEVIVEKIPIVSSLKMNILDIYSVGQRIHQVTNSCSSSCSCLTFLEHVKKLLENVEGEELTEEEKSVFQQMCLKNANSFLLYDQINRKFGGESYVIDNKILKLAITFEIEKIKKYLKAIDTFEKLEWYVYIYSKSFV